jgi:hypothetical protein
MNLREEAEAFRLLLLMGVVDKAELIAWADNIIAAREVVPEWLLDLSLAANENAAAIEANLRDLPGEWNPRSAAYAATDRFADEFQRKGKFTSPEAANMLTIWAASAKVDEEVRSAAMTPQWIADEIPFGNAKDQDVVGAIDECIARFATLSASASSSTSAA